MSAAQVLVVEDRSIIAKDIEKKLNRLGYPVTGIVRSGTEALRQAAKRRPDLVLMDVRLRGSIDGIETAKQLRDRFNVPVVYVTAYSDDITMQRAKGSGPYGYIIKPFEEKELRTTVEMALNLYNMERRLKESEQWFATTLRSIGDAVIATDQAGIVRFMNPSAERLTGWKQEEALDLRLHGILTVCEISDREVCHNILDLPMDTEGGFEFTSPVLLISRDDVERIISLRAARIRDKNEHFLGMVVIFQDITEKVTMEQELLRAQKLESIGTLAGGIAHDFNNFLAAIWASISLARMYASPEDKIHDTLNAAEKATVRARDLTNQLLTFSKGGAPIMKVTALGQLIRESAEFALIGSNVGCEFVIPEDLWPAQVDGGQISQVINNLVINADQSMREGGFLTVRAENITLDGKREEPALKPGKYLRISFSDQGIGIPNDILSRVFDPYFTTKEGGTGLGLATAYSIIKKHDGHIKVETKEGSGTTFTLFLPASVDQVVLEEATFEVASLGHRRVLIMDDEEIIRDVAYDALTHLGCEVALARNGTEAIALYRAAKKAEQPFDVVLMDLTIPGGMGGKEAIKELRCIDEDVKVIVSSGYCNDPIMAQYQEYGFKGVVTKPFSINELTTVLAKVFT